MIDLPLTPPVFAILSGLIEERLGLSYSIEDKELLAGKLSARAIETGFDSLLDYYYFLRYDPGGDGEFEQLASSLVVNETFFFRELPALEMLVSKFVAPLCEAGRTPRIWSAACSTGEEPLTVAMLLAERGLLERVELLATDVSLSALSRAQSGDHSRRSLRQTKPKYAEKWLQVFPDRVVVHPDIQRHVQFSRANLMDAESLARLGRFDVILCRNVLIYFKDATVMRVVDTLSKQLNPGGALCVGISESLMRFGTSLSCEEISGVFVYRKVEP
jgi:chemotaxis protein methyltransferase CheR